MKLKNNRSNQKQGGFTLTELLVVVAVLTILAALCLPALAEGKQKAQRLACLNNLKEVGAAYGRWKNDNGGVYPAQQSYANGGWQDCNNVTVPGVSQLGPVEGPAQGSATAYGVVYNYILLRADLGQLAKLVACPADDRLAAVTFTNSFSKANVSYFVGVGAIDLYPHSILAGDRNMGSWSATAQDTGYGFSEEQLNGTTPGADVSVNVTTYKFTATGGNITPGATLFTGWSAKLHSGDNQAGAGNILLGDGSGQQCSSVSLEQNYLSQAADSGNFAASSTSTSPPNVRFCFP